MITRWLFVLISKNTEWEKKKNMQKLSFYFSIIDQWNFFSTSSSEITVSISVKINYKSYYLHTHVSSDYMPDFMNWNLIYFKNFQTIWLLRVQLKEKKEIAYLKNYLHKANVISAILSFSLFQSMFQPMLSVAFFKMKATSNNLISFIIFFLFFWFLS